MLQAWSCHAKKANVVGVGLGYRTREAQNRRAGHAGLCDEEGAKTGASIGGPGAPLGPGSIVDVVEIGKSSFLQRSGGEEGEPQPVIAGAGYDRHRSVSICHRRLPPATQGRLLKIAVAGPG